MQFLCVNIELSLMCYEHATSRPDFDDSFYDYIVDAQDGDQVMINNTRLDNVVIAPPI